MEETLNKIKQFETTLKRIILETYGKFLPENKISLLNITNYTTNDLLDKKSSSEIRTEMTNRIFHDLIDMNTMKTITLFDGNSLTINYGESLEETVVNYYTKQLSSKYNFNISEVDGLNQDLETVKLLYEKLGDSLDLHVFNDDAVKLLNTANLKEITQKYDSEELKRYFEKVIKVSGINEVAKQKQNDMVKESTERENAIQIVWLNEKKHIKYIDPYGEVHLTDIENAPKTEEFLKERLANVGPNEKLDSEELFHELQKYYAEEMELQSTSNVKKEELNNQQVDMLNFIKSNPELRVAKENDIMTHNSEMNIHVMQSTKDIVTTEDKEDLGYVESKTIKDGNAEMTDEKTQTNEDISSELISKEEYNRLNNKLFSGEELSREELEALRRATPIYAEEIFNDNKEKQNDGGITLKPKNPYNTGFTLKTFALYFIVLTLFLITTFAIIVLS